MIALLQHGEGLANAALDRLDLDYERALLTLNDLAPLGTAVVSPETAVGLDLGGVAALQAMEAVQEEWRAQYAGTQHLLIGLLATSPQIAAVFAAQDITLDDVRDELRTISG